MEITEFEQLQPDRVDGVQSPANGVGFLLLKAVGDDETALHKALDVEIGVCLDDHVVKFVSAADRRKMASEGVAMANGDFPIPDEGHLRSAVGRLAEYKGDKAAAKRHIIKRARALHLTNLLPEDWNVSKETAEKRTESPEASLSQTRGMHDAGGEGASPEAGDGGEPRHVAAEDEHVDPSDGKGDTAPSKRLPKAQALSQTRSMKAGEVDGTGDHAPDDDDKAKDEAESQTEEVEKGKKKMSVSNPSGSADTDPGSPEWEHKDVALGEKAEALVSQLMDVIRTFTEREKAEGDGAKKASIPGEAEGAIRQLVQAAGLGITPTVSKEIEEMDAAELIKLLDERDARQHKAAKKAKKNTAKGKKVEKAAKGAESTGAAKSADVDPSGEIAALRKRLEELESQPMPTPFLNTAGVARGGLSDPAFKEFKELEDAVASAPNPVAAAEARRRLTLAKMIAQENHRDNRTDEMRYGPSLHPLFRNTSPAGVLGDDTAVKGI